jgi:hypothetical protein
MKERKRCIQVPINQSINLNFAYEISNTQNPQPLRPSFAEKVRKPLHVQITTTTPYAENSAATKNYASQSSDRQGAAPVN